MKIDRLLSIIIIMLNRDRISAAELADRFEVTVRTVYRDMEAIGRAGIPLVSYPGKNGGFGIMENYRIDRQVLNTDEILSIITALKGVYSALDDIESGTALEKITNLLPGKGRDVLESESGKIVFDYLPWGADKREPQLEKKVYRAIRESRILRFDYTGWEGGISTREAEPLNLLFKGYSWYLFAFCCLRGDFRFFKLSRMESLELLNERFEPSNANYRDYIDWEYDDNSGTEYCLKFSSSPAVRLQDYFDPSKIKINPDGTAVVRAVFPDKDWVIRFLMTFGDDLEIMEPLSARKSIKELAENLLKKYCEKT